MNRLGVSRRAWVSGVITVAALAGAGALSWRTATRQSEALSEAERQFWQQQFVRLDGSMLAVSAMKGRPLVLNFWATWCPPCVEELPLLDDFFTSNRTKGWQVLGLAVDQAKPVGQFLQRTPLSFPVAMAGFAGIGVSQALGNLSGGLPFTVVFDSSGKVLHRKMGKLRSEDVQSWVRMAA